MKYWMWTLKYGFFIGQVFDVLDLYRHRNYLGLNRRYSRTINTKLFEVQTHNLILSNLKCQLIPAVAGISLTYFQIVIGFSADPN